MSEKDKLLFKDISQDFSKNSNNYTSIVLKKNRKSKRDIPHPFLKWAGGKRQLIPQMSSYFPKNFSKYIEPFVGGGAIFFYLYLKKMLINKEVILIDINPELINCYKVIKNHTSELITSLEKHKNEKEYYYRIREMDRNLIEYNKVNDIEKASRTLYLNKCCYNGLYRVNSKGQFNVPFGKYKNPNFNDKENLLAVSKALKNVNIYHGSFEMCLEYADKNDFIYFDPPYFPLSKTSSFTSYTRENFGEDSQKRLFNIFKKLDKLGCKLVLSNSANDFIKNLYKDYKIITLRAKRAINCDAEKRGNINTILVLNDFSD